MEMEEDAHMTCTWGWQWIRFGSDPTNQLWNPSKDHRIHLGSSNTNSKKTWDLFETPIGSTWDSHTLTLKTKDLLENPNLIPYQPPIQVLDYLISDFFLQYITVRIRYIRVWIRTKQKVQIFLLLRVILFYSFSDIRCFNVIK